MTIRIRKVIPIIPSSSSSLSAVTSAAAAPLLHRGGTRRGRTSAGAARRRSGRHRADAFPAASGEERHVTKRVGPFPRQESINLLQECVIDPAIQRVPSKLRLCYVDLDFECSTVCLTLLGLMGIWAEAAGQDGGTQKSKSIQPRSTSTWDALQCL